MDKRQSEAVIVGLVHAVYGTAKDQERARHLLQQSLHGLVRLAASEMLMQMRDDAARAVGEAEARRRQRITRAMLRRIGRDVNSGQLRLQF